MTSILCLCVHNSARSQMTEAYLRLLGGEVREVRDAIREKVREFVAEVRAKGG